MMKTLKTRRLVLACLICAVHFVQHVLARNRVRLLVGGITPTQRPPSRKAVGMRPGHSCSITCSQPRMGGGSHWEMERWGDGLG